MATHLIDRTVWELSMERAPRQRTALYRLTLALQAAGAAGSVDDAEQLIWDATEALGGRPTVREALEHARVDARPVFEHLRLIDGTHREQQEADEHEKWKRALL